MIARMPVLVLAGSDRDPAPVPKAMHPEEMLTGYKGALRLPGGAYLAQELVGRLRCSGRFEDPILVGPRRVYAGLVDCEIVDVEGDLARTLECVRRLIYTRLPPSAPLALTTCDILPRPAELRELIETGYDPCAQCAFWGQLVEAKPEEMGSSAWKPAYAFRAATGPSHLHLYPGHLLIVRPAALRIRLTNHLLQLAYRYRNRDLKKRYVGMVARCLDRLIHEDLANLRRRKPPTLTFSIPYHGLSAFFRYRRGQLRVAEFEHRVRKVFLHRAFQGNAGGCPVVFALTPIVSFAKDIDTWTELEEIGR